MKLSAMLHHRYAKTVIVLAVIIVVALGLFVAAGLSVRVVESSSMCIPNNTVSGPRDYTLDYFVWTLTHPFNQTLNVGDLIVIQHVDPKTLNTDYPNSDIIVYRDPTAGPSADPIVHRIVTSYTENGTIYFQTKGDGNPSQTWPNPVPSSEYDSNTVWVDKTGQGVPANLVEGKVIMRVPYLGWITLFFRYVSWGEPLVIGLVLLLIIFEFVAPLLKQKPKPDTTNSFVV